MIDFFTGTSVTNALYSKEYWAFTACSLSFVLLAFSALVILRALVISSKAACRYNTRRREINDNIKSLEQKVECLLRDINSMSFDAPKASDKCTASSQKEVYFVYLQRQGDFFNATERFEHEALQLGKKSHRPIDYTNLKTKTENLLEHISFMVVRNVKDNEKKESTDKVIAKAALHAAKNFIGKNQIKHLEMAIGDAQEECCDIALKIHKVNLLEGRGFSWDHATASVTTSGCVLAPGSWHAYDCEGVSVIAASVYSVARENPIAVLAGAFAKEVVGACDRSTEVPMETLHCGSDAMQIPFMGFNINVLSM